MKSELYFSEEEDDNFVESAAAAYCKNELMIISSRLKERREYIHI